MKQFYAMVVVMVAIAIGMTAQAHVPDQVFPSTGGGSTWETMNSGTTNHLAAVHFAKNVGWVVGAQGVILRTLDGGSSWQSCNSGTSENLNGVWFLDANKGFVVGNNGTALVTADGGATWHSVPIGTKRNLRAVAFTELGYGVMVGDSATVITSKDFGTKWTQKVSGISERLNAVAFADNENGFIVGDRGVLLRMVNGADAWPQVMLDVPLTNGKLMSVTMPEPGTVIVAGEQGLIFRSTDNGKKWLRLQAGTNKTIYGINFTDIRHGTVVGDGGNVYRTTTTGWSWTKETTTTTGRLTGLCYCEMETGYIVGENGLILRSKNSPTGIYTGPVDMPRHFNIRQNYPNPFNPTTSISFELKQTSPVTLIVYNTLAQPVRTLVDGMMSAGEHTVNFDAAGLESGVYIAQMRSGASEQTIRMILNK